ncbi:MAG: 16S rRNA (cytidine(1402)-2'-O)-methyltransferase [Fibrobacter sp.]|nr:16S rRNA (cytidine(1402)-2'-O)-methyltransferase [Fibrobacter sp.]
MALYIVSTPIGNLGDISYRAVKILSEVDHILAEDTRVSRNLLNHFGITKSCSPYHDFNKHKVTPALVERLKGGENIALISDAGTPGIADPAFNLVRAAIKENVAVIPIPGASAILAALVCSGLPTDRFVFENFLPHKSSQRRKLFESLKTETRTVIFYETPHRIQKVLQEIHEILGDVQIVLARELTKLYEQFLRGNAAQLLNHFEKTPPRGEMVVLFNIRVTSNSTSEEVHTIIAHDDKD